MKRVRTLLMSGLALVIVFYMAVSAGALPATEEWFRSAAAPYKGVTIKGISESTVPSNTVAKMIPEFERITGINVEFETTSWGEMYTKSIADMVGRVGIYDFIYIEQDIVYSYLQKKWLTDLTSLMNVHPEITSPDLDIDDFTVFINYFKEGGHVFGLPFEAFLKLYTYRKDLFNDPKIKGEFRAKYGWELRPPKNWDEYKQIATFFYEWGKERKPRMYGHTAQVKGVTLPYTFVETYWPSHRVWNWGIDLKTMRASAEKGGNLNSKASKDTLKLFIDLLGYAPPGVRTYSWEGAAMAIATEKSPQGLVYGDQLAWVTTDPEKSAVIGKVAVTLPPTLPGVLEEAEARKGYIGYYDGGAFGIPYSSRQKGAAWLFMQWATRKEVAVDFGKKALAVVRKSALNELVGSKFDEDLGGYFTIMKEKGYLFSGAAPFPFHKVLIEGPLFEWLHKAVAGDVSPEEAVGKMTEEVDLALVRLGY